MVLILTLFLCYKIFSILFLFIFISGWFSEDNKEMNQSSTTVFALTSLLPTLIHVYVFTGLFMLFGALKSRSKTGLMSVGAFIILPIILIFVVPVKSKTNYISALLINNFIYLHCFINKMFFKVKNILIFIIINF